MKSNFTLLLLILTTSVCAFAKLNPAAHPLDPLSESEIGLTTQVLKEYRPFPKESFFSLVALQEPTKAEVQAFQPGASFQRKAFAVVLDRKANQSYEAHVDLTEKKVLSWKKLPSHIQPIVLDSEYEALSKIVKGDARWQNAMRKRGISDFDRVWVDTWATGNLSPKEHQAKRLLRGVSYFKDGATNFYGRPIEGVIALVDMNQEKVIEVTDSGVVSVPKIAQELDPQSLGKQRDGLKSLTITTSQGPSFETVGNEVRWQKWSFRWAMHPREGLVLYNITYNDQGKVRPILYRAALSETVVPYGDPDKNWSWRNAFDEGEYGLGKLAAQLEPGIDAPENAVLFDADFATDLGKPYKLKNSVALYERDGGILWKHYDMYTSKNESRRARELVLFSVIAIGNYDYSFSWIFHQDGSIDVDIGLTGIMLPKGMASATEHSHSTNPHSHAVAKNVAAPHHQHFFNYRLDFNVDGEKNSAIEMNTRAMPHGPGNPLQGGILMEETVLKTEKQAMRDLDMKASRKWKIINASVKNSLGMPSGYALLAGENCVPYIGANSPVRKRAGFINHHFWVTQYHPDETYAAGYYPNQSSGGDGLEKWVGNEKIENQDLVAWYTLGVTHVPRPEEWPVMPVTHAGFRLVPVGFFDRNPALDVPK